ncbi:hypothetical protein [Neobacillus thermocopriae]|uniref:Uncharacterized protein n=1 Tax=Neobacillus thermocopriae TaxID=1215031 RepID=A0A6B3TS20_9BACI|nr:hypothetical protein [Neobacillus thermocopriae]MED3623051.1 hypothetical protein [Neobacillus thermocopriae]MED3714946.1 hypothetical protein [Neobacillus thermocopriae]NEX78801.1 hypothetical protein [Neobacillus thermocopriae]
MINEFKLYFYRHKPFLILTAFIFVGCMMQYFILSGENISSVKDVLGVSSEGLIYQNFAADSITFLSLVYFIYCSASSIINDKRNGVFMYSFVKKVPSLKILTYKFTAAYSFVLTSNVYIILFTSIIALSIYGGEKEMIFNAILLLLTKSYTAIFYVSLGILFALLVNNYVFVLSIFFIVEMAKIGVYSVLNKFSFSKFIVLNHIDISYFFDLPSKGIDRGFSFPFTLLIYFVYLLLIVLMAFYTFTRKKGRLI